MTSVSSRGAVARAASEELRPIGFSTLVLRPGDKWIVATANEETRFMMLELMRKRELHVVGDDLVFGKRSRETAELLLGGTIFDLECARDDGDLTDCVMGVHWEVLDVKRDEVIYRAKVYGSFHDRRFNVERAIQTLLENATDELVKKEHFRQLQKPRRGDELADLASKYEKAQIKECTAEPVAIEKDGNWALRSVAVVVQDDSFGSGFMISDDPFLVTAAHVVDVARPEVRFMNGHKSKASVIRIDREADVALLRVDEPAQNATCLRPTPSSSVTPGSTVFVLGSPRNLGLAFSMSRGILSGTRIYDRVTQLQTDASVNFGNSGGPMVDSNARVMGVVSSKFTGQAAEGLAFAVSMRDGLERLGLAWASESDAALLGAPAIEPGDSQVDAFEEPDSPRPPLKGARDDDDDDDDDGVELPARYQSAPFTAPYAVRLTPGVSGAYFPQGYQEPTLDWQPNAATQPVFSLQVGFGVYTTFAFGLYLGVETRLAFLDPEFKCQSEQSAYAVLLDERSGRECVVPTWEVMPTLGYDIRLGSNVVLRPKVGTGLAYALFKDNPFTAATAGLDLPLQLGDTRLALTPSIGATLPFTRQAGVDIWPLSFRAGLTVDIGVGRLSR